MASFITKYMEECDKCQHYQKDIHPKAQIHPQEVSEGPWQLIGIDLISPLPMSKGKDMILNVVNHYTKQIHLFPVTSQITADRVAGIYFDFVFPLHGVPHKIISDRGPQFVARSMHALSKWLGIDAGLITAYHPQANGQVKQKNQEVEAYLCLFISKCQDDWVDLLSPAEFDINSWLNSVTGHMPFELLYGYTLDFTIPAERPIGIPLVDKCLQKLCSMRIDAGAALCFSKEHMKTTPQHHILHKFVVGDQVWLQAKQIKIHQQSAKLGPKQLGPFKVTEVLSDIDYRLTHPQCCGFMTSFMLTISAPTKGTSLMA